MNKKFSIIIKIKIIGEILKKSSYYIFVLLYFLYKINNIML